MSNKRVYCLYRVSTIGQVEKNDIPMQKECCREFVDNQSEWTIIKEIYEKGVSGFKLSAKERDAIQEIQRDAIQGKFDVLLVFMFDRLGRRDDETPFIVEWFVQNGIEVWSATEGQQRFDNHVDKLLNYIRYWQASGESIKTSVRVKTRLEQLTEKGLFTGGVVPYGYRLECLGRTNKRNKPVNDLVIDDDAAQIIRLIFDKYVNEGYGAQRLSRYLSENRIFKADGSNFPNTSINRIIKNKLYIGIIHNGEVESEIIPELQIIDPKQFYRAQQIMESRTKNHSDVPLNTKSRALLVGNVFCGHCRNRLTLTTSGRRRVNKEGIVIEDIRPRYQCHYKVRHPGECEGQSGYGVKKLDGIIDKLIRMQFSKICASPCADFIRAQHEKNIGLAQAKLRAAKINLIEKQKELADYQTETIKVIRGESKLDAELLNALFAQTKAEVDKLSEDVNLFQIEYEEVLNSSAIESEEYGKILSWADLYDGCSFEAKKMIAAQFIKAVYVHRDYKLEVEFNVGFDEFKKLTLNYDA